MGLADLFRPKHRHSDVRVRSEAVRSLGRDDHSVLEQVARTDRDPAVRKIAIEKLDEPDVLAEIASGDTERSLRDLAGSRAAALWTTVACSEDADAEVLRALATDATIKEVGLAAVDKIDDPDLLESVAQKAKNKAVRQRARKIVTEMSEAERAAAPKVADEVKRRRAEKAQLIR